MELGADPMTETPRTFADLADHARDVQREAVNLQTTGHTPHPTPEMVAWQLERLAAQFAEAMERCAGERETPTPASSPDEWNGNTYRVELVAVVEANTAEEAQRDAGDLLAGRGVGGPIPLTGPGSWAPDTKRVELVELDREADEWRPANRPLTVGEAHAMFAAIDEARAMREA